MKAQLKEIANVWPDVRSIFSVPHSEKEYEKLVNLLDGLIDEVGNNDSHPLASLIGTLGGLIETYESQNIPETKGDPVDALKALMEEHGIRQSELPEIGSQGVLSEIISGKRQLNIRQIKELGNRFTVSPAVFV